MAGHLPISLIEDKRATDKVKQIINLLGIIAIKNMVYFQRVKCCGVTIQRLSPEYSMEENTGEIFSIVNWHFKKGQEDEFEGCNIEVHLTEENIKSDIEIKQLYFVA